MFSIPTPAWGLIGVLLGFFLGEGNRLIQEKCRIRKQKKVLESELRSIRAQIESKEDILLQAIQECKTRRILPPVSVRTVRTGYDAHIDDLYIAYSGLERNCLHVIYERLRICYEIMDSFDKNFKNPWSAELLRNHGMSQ